MSEINSWSELSKLTAGQEVTVERVRIGTSDIHIEGQFDLPPLAKLSFDDQVFVSAFISTHGSIKEMERLFGVSYPTIKARLNALASKFSVLDVGLLTPLAISSSKSDVLARLERGEITSREALAELKP